MRAPWLLLPALAVALVFGQTASFGFVNFDDPGYLAENPRVLAGLTLDGIAWAFTTLQEGHWHPLTWVSHMAAVSVFGAEPGPHHAINVVLHALNAVFLARILDRATGRTAPSLVVALLFAVHPLRAESVAWITERKDVLSTLFWMLATNAWLGFVETGQGRRRLAALAWFALGLLTKPMVITLPFTFLLLDAWPLARARALGVGRLVVEKAPFFALCAASAAVAWFGQNSAGAMTTLDETSLAERLANATTSWLAYLGQWLWPASLGVFYPLEPVRPGLGVAAALALALLTLVLWKNERGPRPMMIGWLWYLGTFVPVIGLVQIGGQSMADRFTYVPAIGLGIVVVWGWLGLAESPSEGGGRRVGRVAGAVVAVALVAALGLRAHAQTAVWRDSRTLWEHTVSLNPDNFMAHNNLSVALSELGLREQADLHASEAARLNPTYPPARINHGNALARAGNYAEALENYAAALARDPSSVNATYNSGLALARMGRHAEAEGYYRRALALDPNYAMAHFSLGALLAGSGRPDEGIEHLRQAASLRPGWQEPLDYLRRYEQQGSS